METGTIFKRLGFGAGLITPLAGGDTVLFTERTFNETWDRAVVGRPVEFERYVGKTEAKRVIGK